ncbi:MAG: ABC transporter substrate-binding protein [Candidatus Tectimicrobiota bacterium]|nr:MAG: ABC transporter substrate-binding protein [Candidatus Tectomicrobia bacterium]
MWGRQEVNRRDFLRALGLSVGVATVGRGATLAVPMPTVAQAPPKGKIPSKPLRVGHMTFFTGPGAVLAAPSYKGHLLAAEEINAAGGLLGKRLIETVPADEAAGTDANVEALQRLKRLEGIEVFTGVISSGNALVLGPVAEELKLLTLFTDGCTDLLFDRVLPTPKYVFRVTNLQSADGVTCAVAVAQTWPEVRKIAHLHPDYSYGRNAFDHFTVAIEKLLPHTEVVFQGWPKLFTTDFTPYITKVMAARPHLLVSSLWGSDYVAFYKQALRYGLFDKMKFASTIAFGVAPHAIGSDHPTGVIAGVHANYYFTYPPGNMWPVNKGFVERFYKRWQEYPNFEAEGAYTALYLLKTAIERANKLVGGWPDDEAIIAELEGLSMVAPAGYIYIRPDNHQAYKDAVTGFAMKYPDYPFPILDPQRMITIPIRNVTAPPGWPKKEPTATYTWIQETWPKAYG